MKMVVMSTNRASNANLERIGATSMISVYSSVWMITTWRHMWCHNMTSLHLSLLQKKCGYLYLFQKREQVDKIYVYIAVE